MPLTHWDDFVVDAHHDLGAFQLDRDAATAFHRAFDPAATDAAPSGLFLVVNLMRKLVDAYLGRAHGLGAAGVTDVAWVRDAPLGVDLTVRLTVTAARPLKSRPGVGFAQLKQEVSAPDGRRVLSWRAHQFMRMRDSDAFEAKAPARLQAVPDSLALTPTHIVLGVHTFTRDDILAFAERFDPQRFHLDEDAARDSLFGALCASGWHTTAVWHRCLSDHLQRQAAFAQYAACGASSAHQQNATAVRGLASVKWLTPTYVGDTLTFVTEPDAEAADPPPTPSAAPRTMTCYAINQFGQRTFEIEAILA
ncbi:MAG: hypothetical protein AAGG99_04840 [Pseudomonadota bacterium]